MLVKYVGEKFSVCWWKVCSRKNFSFHQHASPTLEKPTISLDSKIAKDYAMSKDKAAYQIYCTTLQERSHQGSRRISISQ